MSDLTRGLAALDRSADDYEAAENYYEGAVPEHFTSTRLMRAVLRSGLDTRFNFAKKPVEARAERLEIAGISSPDGEAADASLGELWDDNQLGLEAPLLMRKALTYGDAYLIVWPAEEGPASAPQAAGDGPLVGGLGTDPLVSATDVAESGRVYMFYNGPDSVRVFYDPENPLRKSYAIKRWETGDGVRANLYYPDRIEKYWSKDGEVTEAKWEPHEDDGDDGWPVANPFGEIPVFHFRTDRPYGRPVHEGFYGPQDAITKLITGHLSTVDYQTGPQRYAMLEAGTDSDDAEDTDFTIDGDETESSPAMNGEGASQYTASPGSLWLMRGVKGFGHFDPADPATFTDPMLTYLRMGADITTTPMDKIDPTGAPESGESRRARESGFVKSVRMLQLSFGTTWREAFEFALRLRGIDTSVDVRWAPAEQVDDKDFWEVANLKKQFGIPQYQIGLEAGYTADQLAAWGISPDQTPAAPNGGTE